MEQAALVNALGRERISLDQAELDGYARDISFANRVRPASLVKPKSAAEVQKILRFANETKTPLIAQGLIVDDGGAAFGWGVEQGHVGKTEIFCKFDPHNPVAKKAVKEWHSTQSARAFNERYFALLAPGQSEEIGRGLSNYHLW